MKVFIASMLIFLLGVSFLYFENKYYQYVDADGFLHESLFLPLGVILILLSSIGVVFFLAQQFMKLFDKGKHK